MGAIIGNPKSRVLRIAKHKMGPAFSHFVVSEGAFLSLSLAFLSAFCTTLGAARLLAMHAHRRARACAHPTYQPTTGVPPLAYPKFARRSCALTSVTRGAERGGGEAHMGSRLMHAMHSAAAARSDLTD